MHADPLKWFATEHLRSDLRPTVEAYRHLARSLVEIFEPSPERTIALRFLEQSKDYAVRAHIMTLEGREKGPYEQAP